MKSFLLKHRVIHLLFSFVLISFYAQSQNEIMHPVSEISGTAKYYSFIHNEANGYKEIKYFIVKTQTGEIKTAFDACDVCYAAYKGFRQEGNYMVCNNCGNKYTLDELGSTTTGGCWPGYLEHTIVNNQVVIKEDNIIGGAWYFKLTPTSIEKNEFPSDYLILMETESMVLKMSDVKSRNISLVGINGKVVYSSPCELSELSIDLSNFNSGIYILYIEENDATFSRKIIIQ